MRLGRQGPLVLGLALLDCERRRQVPARERINSRWVLKTARAWVTLPLTLETDPMFCYLASHIHFTGATLVMDGSDTRTLNGTRAAASDGYLAGRNER